MQIDRVGNLCLWCMEEMGDSPCCPYCGHDTREPMRAEQAIPAGRIIGGHYLIGRTLGQGGFGITYLAYDLDLHIKRAIKEYFPQGLAMRVGNTVQVTRQSVAEIYQKGVDSFYREAQSIARFGGHPNVVQVHAFFRENGTAYFVMDYVEGISFQQYLNNRGGRISWEEALRILKPIGEALSALHESHLLHRDVKPDNIFITRNGTPKLLDFGAARYETSETTHSSAAVLTPGYAPVEQYGSMTRQGTFTDVYAFSATFYRAVSGVVPIPAPDRMVTDPLVPLDKLDGRVPTQVGTALSHGMGVHSEKRTQSVAQLLKELDTPVKEHRQPKWLLPMLAALALVALGVGIGKFSGSMNAPSIQNAQSGEAAAVVTEDVLTLVIDKASEVPMETPEPTANQTMEAIALRETNVAETLIAWKAYQETEMARPTATAIPIQDVITDEIRNAQAGDHVYYGHYEQDNDLSNGAEAIEWRVLAREGNRLLLLSEYGLDAKPYNDKYVDITWETCTLRSWLNGEFYKSAFNAEEQAQIAITGVKAVDDIGWEIDEENVTRDRIFLLSISESEIYFTNGENHECEVTNYAEKKGAYRQSDGSAWCWFRSPSGDSGFVSYSTTNDQFKITGHHVNYSSVSVRPALWLNLDVECGDENDAEIAVSTTAQTIVPDVITEEIRNAQAGDHVSYGHYEQDNTLTNGVEAIEWRVLAREENRLLLISEYGLEVKRYHEKYEYITWEKSTLRSWLNGEFYKSAFSAEEQAQIAETNVETYIKHTQDRIFLLSIGEANTYFKSDEDRQCKVTAYGVRNGAYSSSKFGGTGWWWLRSRGSFSDDAAYVSPGGSVRDSGYGVTYNNGSVRPALWLNLDVEGGDEEAAEIALSTIV